MNNIVSAKAKDVLFLVLLSAIWGSAFLTIEIALNDFSPLLIAFFRIFFASIFMLFLVFYKNLCFPKDFKTLSILFITGILNNAIPFFLISWGQQFINGSTASIMLACGPFITLILAHYITHDEKFTLVKLLGVIFGFIGVFILLRDELVNQRIDAIYAEIAILLSSLGYLSASLLLRKVSHVPVYISSASMFITASLVLLPFIILSEELSSLSLDYSFLSLIYLALVPTALASIIRINLVQKVGVQFMSQVAYIIPLFAIFWSYVFFNELPKQAALYALIFILLGLFIRKIKLPNNS